MSYRTPPSPPPPTISQYGEFELPDPGSLGIPSDHFPHWYPGQERAVLLTMDTGKRFSILSAPTGSGKSLIYMAIAALHGGRTVIITATKGLQAQLMKDFGAMGLVEVRGQNSYPCLALEPGGPLRGTVDVNEPQPRGQYTRRGHANTSGFEFSVEDGPCHAGIECPIKNQCEYFSAVGKARRSTLVVANFAFWMTINRYTPQGLGGEKDNLGVDLLIIDEAHEAPDQLAEFASIELSQYEVEGILATRLLAEGSPNEDWQEWAGFHLRRTRGQISEVKRTIEDLKGAMATIPGSLLKQLKTLSRMERKLNQLAYMQGEWIVDFGAGTTRGQTTKFSPVWPGPYAEQYLFLKVPRVVLVSATITERTAHYLGIRPQDLHVERFPSNFPVANRPFIHIPTAAINFRTDPSLIALWQTRIDQIIRTRTDRKGLIHAVSYARTNSIRQNSEYGSLMMAHDSGMAASVVAKFKTARPETGAILISPSMTTGWDFPNDTCRYQILTKVPFPDGRGELMKARSASDDSYTSYLTMMEMVQAYGRGVRNRWDWCETFIIDDSIRWFMRKWGHLAPNWFMEAYRTSPFIPPPMNGPAAVPGK